MNVSHWLGTAAATPTVAGVPEVDVTHWLGTAVATPTAAGVPEVDVTHWIGADIFASGASPNAPGVPLVDLVRNLGTVVPVLVGGRHDVSVGAMAANVLSASALATDAVTKILTTAITEAYRANGAAPTIAQFISEILAHLGEATISGTTKTIKQLDHITAAETFTLDSATDPTSITRAT